MKKNGAQRRGDYELHYREKIVSWVWERMESAHPGKWRKVVGPVWDVKRERERKKKPHLWPKLAFKAAIWAELLKEFPPDAVARAVHAFENRKELPSRMEFIQMCRGESPAKNMRMRAERAIETPEQRNARLARGAEKLAKIRSMVSSGK